LPKTDPTLWKLLARAIAGLDADLGACPGADIHQAALHHGIGPLLHQRATEGTVTGLGPDTLNQLKSLHRIEAALDLWQNETARRVLDALANAGIDALLLKGTVLAHLHYPASHLRPRCDVDLFISETQVNAAADALAALGCQITGLAERKQSSRQFVAVLAGGPQNYTHFDIHWKLSNRVLFRESLRFDACLAEAQPVPALGARARALSNPDLLLHACIHRIAHGRNTERDRLLWLYDIHLLIEAMAPAQQAAFPARAKARPWSPSKR